MSALNIDVLKYQDTDNVTAKLNFPLDVQGDPMLTGDGSGLNNVNIDPSELSLTGDASGPLNDTLVSTFLNSNGVFDSAIGAVSGFAFLGFYNPNTGDGLYIVSGIPASGDFVNSSQAIAIYTGGSPGTALVPGTLIYQTLNAGIDWTAIL